jgi:hypothetical protein
MNTLPTSQASLVNRLTVTGLVAVLASAGVLGAVATLLARQSLEIQAQEKLTVVGDAASLRIGEWVAGNLRTGASVSAAAAPDAIGKAMGEATRAGFAKKRRGANPAHPAPATADFIALATKEPTRAGNAKDDAKPDAAAAAAMAAIAGLMKSAPAPAPSPAPAPAPAKSEAVAKPAPAPAPAGGGAAAAAMAAMAAINKTPAAPPAPAPAAAPAVAAAAPAPSDAASAPAPAADDQALRTALAQALASGDFRTIYMGYDADKRFVQVPLQKMPDGYDPTSRPWYKAAVADGKPVVTQPYKNASSGEMTVTFAIPVKADGKLVGVIGANKPLGEVAAPFPPSNRAPTPTRSSSTRRAMSWSIRTPT